ncbi:hypothetical protein AAHC03_017088 [Spirometra sp. Aus1]
MFRQIILLAVVCSAFGQEFNSTLEFKENSDYVYTKQLHGYVEHMIVDGVKISNPSNGSHCVAPNDCWEIVKPEKLLVAYGFLKGSNATFTVQPANIPDRYPVGIQYKKAGTPECVLKFDTVLFTGHLGTKPRTMEIKFGNGRVDRITITPSNKPGASAPILTFLDFENSFKKY